MSVAKLLLGSPLPTAWLCNPRDYWTANWKVENRIMIFLTADIRYFIKMVNVKKNSEGFLYFNK